MDPRTVTEYFERALRRGQLESIEFSEDVVHVLTARAVIDAGRLPEEDTATLFAQHDAEQDRRRATPVPDSRRDATIPVVISLVTLTEEHGGSRQGLLLLEARLHRDGRLEPVLGAGTSPWIPAERLTAPSLTDLTVMVGPQRLFWASALTRLGAEISQAETLADAAAVADSLFTQVSGRTPAEFAAQVAAAPDADSAETQSDAAVTGRTVTVDLCAVREHDRISAVSALLGVYEAVGREAHVPPLLDRLLTGWQGPRTPESRIHDGDGLRNAAVRTCGSMSDEHPLTPSQRRAVHAFWQDGEEEITAVSGPPGTGKTRMLQAIVAGMITRRALDEEEAPLIVGTSTNNQAVTNIIDSFASVAKPEPGLLEARWLPGARDGEATDAPLRSLAVYCPSAGKRAAASTKHLIEQADRSGVYAEYSAETYLEQARTYFLHRVNALFGSIAEIEQVQGWIRDALVEVDELRLELLDEMDENGPSAEYQRLCEKARTLPVLEGLTTLEQLRGCEDLAALDEVLDVTLRYAEFWLAVHYFEATWLLAEHHGEETRWRTTEDVREEVWRQSAALTPCFVMTVYQVPKYFRTFERRGAPRGYDLGRIDLLIVDEAGQVDTPLAVPALALADRALVVGDTQQLPPVWSLDEITDRELAAGAGIDAATWREDLHPRGVTGSDPGSLMRAAVHASRWAVTEEQPGLLLREHFRCVPDIITICNDLLYEGLLEPRRSAHSSPLHGRDAAVTWIDVPDSEDSRQGASRVNPAEARAVAVWIVERWDEFAGLYHRAPKPEKRVPLSQLIGVVTPFRAQAELITAEIRRAAADALAEDPEQDLPADLAHLITVGTAHRLQGAERPIIAFSAVYGRDSATSSFIDANPQLMNVAVSRAKDLLVVFAAPNRWRNGPVFELVSAAARRREPGEVDGGAPGSTSADGTAAEPAPAVEGADRATARDEAATDAEEVEDAVVISTLLARWRRARELREDDSGLTPAALNLRLAEAGIIEGEPGHWRATALAARLGAIDAERTSADGEPYVVVEYAPRLQHLLLELYREGTV